MLSDVKHLLPDRTRDSSLRLRPEFILSAAEGFRMTKHQASLELWYDAESCTNKVYDADGASVQT